MAEGGGPHKATANGAIPSGAPSTRVVPCRFFIRGNCKDGENCRFLHCERETNTSPPLASYCRYYQIGQCQYGNQCRYIHRLISSAISNPMLNSQSSSGLVTTNNNSENIPSNSATRTPPQNVAQQHVAPPPQFFVPSFQPFSTHGGAPLRPHFYNQIPPPPPEMSHLQFGDFQAPLLNIPITEQSSSSSRDLPCDTTPTTSSKLPPKSLANQMNSLKLNTFESSSATTTCNKSKKQSNMVSLNSKKLPSSPEESKPNNSKRNKTPNSKLKPVQLPSSRRNWAEADVFIPQSQRAYEPDPTQSWAKVAATNLPPPPARPAPTQVEQAFSELCPFYITNKKCAQLSRGLCPYVHGDVCEVCQLACLNPNSEEQRKIHEKECSKFFEDDMELSFAVARSMDKCCGICMDTVMDRELGSQRRFGILPNCSHIFCLECIRKWRQSKSFENKIVRSCPECRVQSDFIIPSRLWVDENDKEEKEKLVSSYIENMGKKECKYFNKGEGTCPFGNRCFYRHALPDGTLKDVGPPKRKTRVDAEGFLQDEEDISLWDFMSSHRDSTSFLRLQALMLELREHHMMLLRDDYLTSDSDD